LPLHNPQDIDSAAIKTDPPPTWIKPLLAKLVETAPDGPDWLHEIKLHGYRMHARLDAGRVEVLTRRGNDWTGKYPAIVKSIAGLPARNAYLDGELCGVLPDGRTAFNLIQNASDTDEGSLVFFLFDLLHLEGESLTALPLIERKTRLASLPRVRPTRCDTTITRSGMAWSSIEWPANTVWRALSQTASMVGMSPTGERGSRPNVSTERNLWSLGGVIPRAADIASVIAAGLLHTRRQAQLRRPRRHVY